uniref:Acid phosphatase 5, tartrate resistant n=1 Tax=Gallus gallus TaxID=9031 RepID=A0A8V0XJX2_CHICK
MGVPRVIPKPSGAPRVSPQVSPGCSLTPSGCPHMSHGCPQGVLSDVPWVSPHALWASPHMSHGCPLRCPQGVPWVSPHVPWVSPQVPPGCPQGVPKVSPRCPHMSSGCPLTCSMGVPSGAPRVSPRCPLRCPQGVPSGVPWAFPRCPHTPSGCPHTSHGCPLRCPMGVPRMFPHIPRVSPRCPHTPSGCPLTCPMGVPSAAPRASPRCPHTPHGRPQDAPTHPQGVPWHPPHPRRRFPHYYYSLRLHVPGTNATARLLVLDTVLLCGATDDFGVGATPRGPPDAAAAEAQLSWLQRRLAAARHDRYVLVAGHYPVWSVAEHGPTQCLLRLLRPLLRRHRVTAYLCGHDHNLQFLHEDGVGYVVSGAGNFMEASQTHRAAVPPGAARFFYGAPESPGGFAHLRLDADAATITFLEANGRVLYRVALPPRDL